MTLSPCVIVYPAHNERMQDPGALSQAHWVTCRYAIMLSVVLIARVAMVPLMPPGQLTSVEPRAWMVWVAGNLLHPVAPPRLGVQVAAVLRVHGLCAVSLL
jgi:hypothetical protein